MEQEEEIFTTDMSFYLQGRIVEIYGQEASGKTTLALHTIKEAQKQGGVFLCNLLINEALLGNVFVTFMFPWTSVELLISLLSV